jgi:hypothetical protein
VKYSIRIVTLAALLVIVSSAGPVWSQAIKQPDCAALEEWAAKQGSAGTWQIAPKVTVSGLLRDDLAEPVFGRGVLSWEKGDLNAVRGWLNDCRRAANKRRDKEAGNNLYAAMKAVASARAPLTRMQSVRQAAEQRVQKLTTYPPSPDMLQVLTLAQEALRGKDVESQTRQIHLPGGITHEASGLRQGADYLPEGDIAPLIAHLEAHQKELRADVKDVQSEMSAAKQELDSAPMSQEGLDTLDRLARAPVLKQAPRDDVALFQRALQQKRAEIERALLAQGAANMRAAQQARAKREAEAAAKRARPVDVAERLGSVIGGESLEDVSILGFKSGVDHEQAVRHVESKWRFERTPSLDPGEHYSANRQDRITLRKTAGRDGGTVAFQTMDGTVGHIEFVEYYMGRLDANAVRDWLTSRLGAPTKEQAVPLGRVMDWADDSIRLQVTAVNQVEYYAKDAGYVSKLDYKLWNVDFERYKVAEKQRCDEIRNKPMSQLSIADKTSFTSHCVMKQVNELASFGRWEDDGVNG